jgi:hypothetical protein
MAFEYHGGIRGVMYLHVFRRAIEQLEISKSDGDSAYFTQLLYFGEFLSKMTTAALCAGISEDSDRHRYALLYRLVRADSIGGWAQVVDEIAAGPTSRLLRAELQEEKTQLNTRSTAGTWQYRSISLLDDCMRKLSPDRQGLPVKLEGRLWFSYFAELRNAPRVATGSSPLRFAPTCHRSFETASSYSWIISFSTAVSGHFFT